MFYQFHQVASYTVRSVLHARCSSPNSAITVILHEEKLLHTWRHFTAGARITLHVPSNTTRERERVFAQHLFRPSSVQPAWISVFWFIRFLAVQQYMLEAGIQSALFIDLDILVFGDLASVISRDTAPVMWASFATHWTIQSITAFTDHMWWLYSQNDTQLAASMLDTGETRQDYLDMLYDRKEIDAWWPHHIQRAEFSDMHFMKHL